MEADPIAFGVEDVGVGAHARGESGFRQENGSAGLVDEVEDGVKRRAGVEVDDRAVGAGR